MKLEKFNVEWAVAQIRERATRTGETPADAVAKIGTKTLARLEARDRMALAKEGLRSLVNDHMHHARGVREVVHVSVHGSLAERQVVRVSVQVLEQEYVINGETKKVALFTVLDARALAASERSIAEGHLRSAEMFERLAAEMEARGVATAAELGSSAVEAIFT